MNRVEAALALVAKRLWPGPGTSPHATPLAEAVYRALEAIANEQTKTDALLREMIKARPDLAREQTVAARLLGYIEDAKQTAEAWKARAVRAEDLAREKADAEPQIDGTSAWAERERRLALEVDRTAALRRAEAAEKERDGRVADYERTRVAYETAKTECYVAKNAATVWERHYVEQRDAAQTLRGQLVSGRAAKEEVEQERDALRADCEGLSKLHEQDKAELARWRKAAKELRSTFPKCRHDETPSDVLVVHRVLDAAEDKAAPLSTPPPDAEDLAAVCARAEHLERERNSALLQRNEVQKAYREAKEALRQWGYAAESLKEMFPEHLNHAPNSCVACLVRDRIARAENPPDTAF